MQSTGLQVFEIFKSINGEVTSAHQGSICTFIRLSGCNLRCVYCDTPKTWRCDSGINMAERDILREVLSLRCKNITITGGEPLLQNIEPLLKLLSSKDYKVSIETNGTRPISSLLSLASCWVVDYKLSSSGLIIVDEDIYSCLREGDFVKFAISSKFDIQEAIKASTSLRNKGCRAKMAFSPVFSGKGFKYSPLEIFNYLNSLNITDAIINIQVHKFFNFL